tara:strand:- start:11684 stop:12520 length:837 start_codon:yes stop_codon:yes gene_type:complete
MRVLITGRNGFLARELSDRLDDFEVTCVGRQEVDLTNSHNVDLFFEDKTFDAVLHTAIIGGRRGQQDEFKDFSDNVSMFSNLLRHKDKFNKFINFCSGAAFGRCADIYEWHENRIHSWLPGGGDYYGMSKNIIGRECNKLDGFYNLRLFGCFGFHEAEKRFVKSALEKALVGEPIVIHQNKMMDYISAEDICTVVRHYLVSDIKKELQDINICYEDKTTLRGIAVKIVNLTKSESEIIIEEPGFSVSYTGNADKLKSLNLSLQGIEKGLLALLEKLIG